MKNLNGMSFGFSAVTTGVRKVDYEPELSLSSTVGNIRITPPVTKALFLSHGDYLMFINNIDGENGVLAAIQNRDATLVAFCEENGLDIDSPEAANAIVAEFGMWAIAKGIQLYDSKGVALTVRERMTDEDKRNYVLANYDAVLEGAKNGNDEETKAAIARDGITKEEIVEILADGIQGSLVPKFKGAKLANPSGITGIGATLTCSDGATWNTLKEDLGEEKTSLIKTYEVNLDNPIEVEVNNGHEIVKVKALLLGDSKTSKPIVRTKKAAAEKK